MALAGLIGNRFSSLFGKGKSGLSGETVYHRFCDLLELEQVRANGEVWGTPPRNIFKSDIPCVKAFVGELPAMSRGYEFTTEAVPTFSSPYERRWLEGSSGVWVEDGFAKIRVAVRRFDLGDA
jgi:hypothetical protein